MELSNKILSDITVHMKYAKFLPEMNRRETWEELVTRNKEMHQKKYPHIKDEIEEVYKLVYDKKILPSMRSLQFGGKPIEISPNRVYNCAYLPIDHTDAFSETMFLLLGGTGVCYSVEKHHVDKPVAEECARCRQGGDIAKPFAEEPVGGDHVADQKGSDRRAHEPRTPHRDGRFHPQHPQMDAEEDEPLRIGGHSGG